MSGKSKDFPENAQKPKVSVMVEVCRPKKVKWFLTRITKKPQRRKNAYGFDIETKNRNKDFLLGVITNEKGFKRFFEDRISMRDFIKSHPATYIGTYLQFDAGMLFPKGIKEGFMPFFRNSDMIGGRIEKSKFLDTMNYARLGVEKLGKIIGINKMQKPDFSKEPQNSTEWEYLRKYNHNDALISITAFRHFEDTALKGGYKLKTTISSTAMDDFCRNDLQGYMKKTRLDDYKKIIQAYSGGRVEAFMRGDISHRGYRLYDYRSHYPAVMLNNDFPCPNSMRYREDGKVSLIKEFFGVCRCIIQSPVKMRYPFLHYKNPANKKLCFPLGILDGWYTHAEILKSLELGYKILWVGEQYYFTRSIQPFKSYIMRHHNKRVKYEMEGKTGEAYFEKIMMNGLYGKFGERPEREEVISKNEVSWETMQKEGIEFGSNADYIFMKRNLTDDETSPHQIPILAIYVTAYGRIKLYDSIVKYEAIYCDTDSIITKHLIPEIDGIGNLKFEGEIIKGMIIKAKMYIIGKVIKIKGFSRANMRQAKNIIKGKNAAFMRFSKFKECQSHNWYYNQPRLIKKCFNIEDDKRIWNKPFCDFELQDSQPLRVGSAV